MANNLTLTSGAAFSGGALTTGTAKTPLGIYPSLPFSIAVKTVTSLDMSGGVYGLIGQASGWSLYCNHSNDLTLTINNAATGDDTFTTSFAMNDGAPHDLVMVFDTAATRLYVDQNLIRSSTTIFAGPRDGAPSGFALKGYLPADNSATLYDWGAPVSQAAMYNYAFGTGSTCPARAALTGSEAGLIAAWPLAADGNDIAAAVVAPSGYFFRGAQA